MGIEKLCARSVSIVLICQNCKFVSLVYSKHRVTNVIDIGVK